MDKLEFKQINCSILNLAYVDFLADMGIVNKHSGTINGAFDEWIDDIQCGDRLRQGILFEEDENYETLQEDKYANEFIFNLFKFIAIGGHMN